MASIQETLRDVLSADSILTGLVGDRIYPGEIPDDEVAPPWLYYAVPESTPFDQVDDADLVARHQVEFHSLADSYATAKAIVDAVIAALNTYAGGQISRAFWSGTSEETTEDGYHHVCRVDVWATSANIIAITPSGGRIVTGAGSVTITAGGHTLTLTAEGLQLDGDPVLGGSGGPQPALDPGTAAFLDVAVLRADDLAGSDGASVNTWAPTRGITGDFTAATGGPIVGAPVLKTGANGINGHKAVHFGDYQTMFSGGGALSLTGAFYAAFVISAADIGPYLMSVLCFGDRSGTSKMRKFLVVASGALSQVSDTYFSGSGNDLSTLVGPAAGVPSLVEFSYAGGAAGVLNVYLNGALVGSAAKTLLPFTTPQIVLSGRPYDSQAAADYGERFGGLLAEVWIASTVPTAEQLVGLRSYAVARYGVALADGGAALAAFDATNSVHESASFRQLTGYGSVTSLTVGGSSRYTTGGLGTTAALSVTGAVAASGTTAEHKFRNAYPLRNTVWIQNTDPSGYSAINCQAGESADNSEQRGAAFGWGNHTAAAAVFVDAGYTEVSDLRAAPDGVNPQTYRVVQTETANGSFRRIEVKNAITFYQRDATYPNESAVLTLDSNGNVVPGKAALATSATDGFLYLPTCAGPPTGTPTAYAGRAAVVYDTSGHKIWIYDGAWKATATLS